MFANYNFSLFPIVIADFDNSELNNYQFDLFLNNWESIYNLNIRESPTTTLVRERDHGLMNCCQ